MSKIPRIPKIILFVYLVIGQIGVSLSDEVSNDKLLNYSLDELLNASVSTASKTDEKISEVAASVTVITREEITRLGYQSLTEIIQNTTGVFNIDNYNRVPASFGVRGAWNPRSINASIAILIDGINQVRDDSRSNPFEKITVPVEAIDRIEVIRGPMSVIYGNGASFGVINIITNQQTENIVAVSTGSLNSYRHTLNYSFQFEKLNLELIASQWGDDGFDYKFEDMTNENGLQFFKNVGNMPDQYSTDNLLELDTNYIALQGTYGAFYFEAVLNEADSEFFIVVPALDEGSLRTAKSKSYSLGYKKNITNDWYINSRFTYNDFEAGSLYEGFVPNQDIGINHTEYQSRDFEVLSNYIFSENINWLIGINYREMKNQHQFSDVPVIGIFGDLIEIKERKAESIFSQVHYKFLDNYQLTFGYRHERIPSYLSKESSFYGYENKSSINNKIKKIINNTPQVALIYSIGEHQVLKAMYGEASKISNENFEPEQTETYEVNHTYTSDVYAVSTSIFQTSINNLVIRDRVVDNEGKIYFIDLASGVSETQGVETTVNFYHEQISGELAVSYQSSENKNNMEISPAYSPEWLVNGQLSYQFENKTYFSILFRYVDKMLPFFDPSINSRIGDEIDSHISIDSNLKISDIFNSDFYLNLKISNLFDEDIRYPNSPENNGFLTKGTIGAERNYSLSLGGNF